MYMSRKRGCGAFGNWYRIACD